MMKTEHITITHVASKHSSWLRSVFYNRLSFYLTTFFSCIGYIESDMIITTEQVWIEKGVVLSS